MSARWRGTVVYIGSLVVIGAAVFAKYGGVLGQDTQRATTAFASASSSATASPEPSPDRSQRARPQATDKSGSTDKATAESADKATAEAEPPETEAPAPPPEEDPPPPEQVTITGAEASSIRGPVQVAVTFEGDRIVDVITIQAGTDARESIRINDEALPILRQEALAAQSAQIDTVSGATYTSDGYRTSLQSAIDQNG